MKSLTSQARARNVGPPQCAIAAICHEAKKNGDVQHFHPTTSLTQIGQLAWSDKITGKKCQLSGFGGPIGAKGQTGRAWRLIVPSPEYLATLPIPKRGWQSSRRI